MKGTSFEESVTSLIRLAHTAQHYDAAGLSKYADLLTKASFIVSGGLGEVGHALKYSQGIAKSALGVDDEGMVLMTALLNRLGLSGSRGGTVASWACAAIRQRLGVAAVRKCKNQLRVSHDGVGLHAAAARDPIPEGVQRLRGATHRLDDEEPGEGQRVRAEPRMLAGALVGLGVLGKQLRACSGWSRFSQESFR
jgi:hypothetical protein